MVSFGCVPVWNLFTALLITSGLLSRPPHRRESVMEATETVVSYGTGGKSKQALEFTQFLHGLCPARRRVALPTSPLTTVSGAHPLKP